VVGLVIHQENKLRYQRGKQKPSIEDRQTQYNGEKKKGQKDTQ
jgi:hypothetical protein